MPPARSPGAGSVVRLLVALLALLLAETLLVAPRRTAAGVAQVFSGEPVAGGLPSPVPDALAPALAAAAAAGAVPGGTVAVAVVERPGAGALTTDPQLSGPEALRPLPTASLVKLFMAEDVLHRARAGLVALDLTDLHRLAEMVRSSDDAAASALWVEFGGGRMVSDVATRYGLIGTAPPLSPGQWGQAVTTARDLAVFLSWLPVVAHPDDAAALLGWMAEATPLAADGYDQRFGLLALPRPVAAKQGWMCCVAGARHLHSAGVEGGRVVVLLSEVPVALGDTAARARLDAVAAALPLPAPPPLRLPERAGACC
jgi:hypothetical protein